MVGSGCYGLYPNERCIHPTYLLPSKFWGAQPVVILLETVGEERPALHEKKNIAFFTACLDKEDLHAIKCALEIADCCEKAVSCTESWPFFTLFFIQTFSYELVSKRYYIISSTLNVFFSADATSFLFTVSTISCLMCWKEQRHLPVTQKYNIHCILLHISYTVLAASFKNTENYCMMQIMGIWCH